MSLYSCRPQFLAAAVIIICHFAWGTPPGLCQTTADSAVPHHGLSPKILESVTLDETTFEWNWGSWDQEKIVSFGDYQYSIFWDADRSLVVGRRNTRTNQVDSIPFPDYKLQRNDRHRNTCLAVSAEDGRLHLSWDHHGNQLRYTKSRAGFLTAPPESMALSDFEPAHSMLDDPKLESTVTYPRFFSDHDGALFFFYRLGKSGNGNNFLQRYDATTGKWTRTGRVFSSQGVYEPWENSTSRNAYLHDLLFDSQNRLHATWVYRETGATWASNHDLHYAYSDDRGETWKNNNGIQIADLKNNDPIAITDPGLVVHEIPINSWVMNAGCMNIDSKNRPHVFTFKAAHVQPKSTGHNPDEAAMKDLVFVHYWRDQQGVFHGGEAIASGSTIPWRGDLVFDRHDNLFFYYPIPTGFRYFTASANEGWKNMSGPYELTGKEFTAPQRNASKHDRMRWKKEGILSFTTEPQGGGFAILDVRLKEQ